MTSICLASIIWGQYSVMAFKLILRKGSKIVKHLYNNIHAMFLFTMQNNWCTITIESAITPPRDFPNNRAITRMSVILYCHASH